MRLLGRYTSEEQVSSISVTQGLSQRAFLQELFAEVGLKVYGL